jgi:hypothetical protein
MGEVCRPALKGRLNFEINFPRTGRKGFGKLRYRAAPGPAAEHGSPGNLWKIDEIFETSR